MEPFPKRQRLYSPVGPAFPQSFDSEEVYYDEDDFVVEEEEEDEQVEDALPDLDPESDFQQKRARLDYKLKSTFESIFEKYGKDFDGVGDEIDLATGEIVVNNGHILEMLDERDAGDVNLAHSVPTELTEESEELPSSVLQEMSDMDEEDDEDDSDEGSEDEMMEDDLILRGFAQAVRFKRPSPELVSLREQVVRPQKPRNVHAPPPFMPNTQKKALPSRSEILAQFGPQLGPQIVDYVSKQSIPDKTPIEPAWRAPKLPAFESRKREVKKPIILPPEAERSPSPEEATSIWALPQQRGRRKGTHVSTSAKFGESSHISKQQERYAPDHIGIGTHDQASGSRRTRNGFTEEEDQIILDWVNRVRRKGEILNDHSWKELEAIHPSHKWQTWKQHYKRHFTYLLSNSTEESEVSVSEPSVNSLYVGPQVAPARTNFGSHNPAQHSTRPNRIRRPAQKDSRIISWSEAVDALESLDPDLHADMLKDAGISKYSNLNFSRSSVTTTKQDVKPANTKAVPRQTTAPSPKVTPRKIIDLTGDFSDDEVAPTPEQHLIPGAPCPHAECRAYSNILYRLQRRDDEQLSEMCLHLFRVHHTTPFPCGETSCPRKGEEGYFMQADLVKHVRKFHPHAGALQRLRGRVDSELLDLNVKLTTPPNDLSYRPVSQPRDSDFMSPTKFPSVRGPSSSHQRSSFSDTDRTPRAPTTTFGASHSTRMTSVSSMRVHHPSAMKTSVEEEAEGNNEQYLDYSDGLSMQAYRSTINSSGGLGSQLVYESPDLGASSSRHSKGTNIDAGNSLLSPDTATAASLDPPLSFFDDRRSSIVSMQPEHFAEPSEVKQPTTVIKETPDPSSPLAQLPSQAQVMMPSSPLEFAPNPMMPPSQPTTTMQRNILDPAYEFSDEEGHVEFAPTGPSVKSSIQMGSTHAPMAVPSMGPLSTTLDNAKATKSPTTTFAKKLNRVVKPSSHVSFTTPSAQKAIRQSILRMALDAEDFDELSLDKDDVVLLSSQPRKTALPETQFFVKQESVMNTPRRVSGPGTKKRRFSALRDGSSPDELAVEGSSPSTIAPIARKTTIKVEDESSLPELPALPNNRTEQQIRRSSQAGVPLSQITPSVSRRQIPIRTSIPLLNLTPSRRAPDSKEIRDSATEESSPPSSTLNPPRRERARRQKVADSSSSPLADLLTPTRKRSIAESLKVEQVTIVVKTPGGTFRSCGDDGFTCGRSFCFRCGSQDVPSNA
ncbi:uncharacterized protein LY89DRAFT_713396 [Mollisia scopiformis]|uniref:TERF2-interacting telomeric protein 1 Myb domain-containing protein n=1 Tax=Mollisia scopiformis TaxID=149040 RepID=A0A194XWH6_MOLSC|nr:uncharacterized protein LY89DRAFT_713396 [Mollisia scopiformis]KUJ24583.1 hypothetical protein LY89DRAFT_713396 [Mollisia scopiformis]